MATANSRPPPPDRLSHLPEKSLRSPTGAHGVVNVYVVVLGVNWFFYERFVYRDVIYLTDEYAQQHQQQQQQRKDGQQTKHEIRRGGGKMKE